VVDWTPSLMAKSSRTHSVDFLVLSVESRRSVFLNACFINQPRFVIWRSWSCGGEEGKGREMEMGVGRDLQRS
jgi:hypothetical protein